MEKHLGDLYHCYSVPVCNTDFGFVGARGRKYGICVLKTSVQAHFASLQNAVGLFHRPRNCGVLAV